MLRGEMPFSKQRSGVSNAMLPCFPLSDRRKQGGLQDRDNKRIRHRDNWILNVHKDSRLSDLRIRYKVKTIPDGT
ncbi:unnamed protein product [Dovyalis caffra]|uniref:Uncharacterized protein n=1 Tax=Dovyalis caffra TaxID=77055 RepID=A0AAV1R9U9_9ROSI|nr:unnamed protein product [Dovyalis caffra]